MTGDCPLLFTAACQMLCSEPIDNAIIHKTIEINTITHWQKLTQDNCTAQVKIKAQTWLDTSVQQEDDDCKQAQT